MRHTVELPPPVRPGDRVGVAALSGPVDGEALARGLATLRRLGFEPVLADNLASRHLLFAGADEERLGAFHRLVADDSLAAVFFARGGHGVLRLLPRIDWSLLGRRPRAYVGYSDLTPLLMEVVRRLGLTAFHGPMVATDLARNLAQQEEESLLASLAGDFPVEIGLGDWLRQGEAEGSLVGGCLSLLTATLGTPFFPDLEGTILFWEEVNEPVYRIDRMLTHLRLSGNLGRIRGMMIGHLDTPEQDDDERWRQVLLECLGGFDWPLAAGLACGHRVPNLTLPLGLPARMHASTARVVFGG